MTPATVPVRSSVVRASDGVGLHVLEAGPDSGAATIVLVPGWTMPAWIWQPQIDGLAGRFRVLAMDPRGQGESELPRDGYGIDRRADDIADVLAAKATSPVILVGWSLAAVETLQCIERHGDARVAGLVLIDSAVGQLPALPENPEFVKALNEDREKAVGGFVKAMFARAQPEQSLKRLTQEALRIPLEQSLALFPKHLQREHWRGITARFHKPLMYVVTERLRPQGGNMKRERPATRVEVFEQAGHALFVDEPERFNALLAEFATAALK